MNRSARQSVVNRFGLAAAVLALAALWAPAVWAFDTDLSSSREGRYTDPFDDETAYGEDTIDISRPTFSLPLAGQTSLRLGADLSPDSWAALEALDPAALRPDQLEFDTWTLGIGVDW